MSLSSLPYTLWHLYLDHLVFYERGSWVDKIASTCRVLAFATIIPFAILTLLDVASYVIARTLGVIDETKASTSGGPDAAGPHKDQPTIVVHESSDNSSDVSLAASTPLPREPSEEDVDGNFKLSGVDTFSPAPSQPGSPTLQRREFMQHSYAHYGSHGSHSNSTSYSDSASSLLSFSLAGNGPRAEAEEKGGDGHGDASPGGSGATTPRDPGSSSGESSFAMLDRDSGSEDAGVVLRRRTRPSGTGARTGPDAGDGVA